MFFLYSHFLCINGLIDADSLKNKKEGERGKEDETNKLLRVAESLPDVPPFSLPPMTPLSLSADPSAPQSQCKAWEVGGRTEVGSAPRPAGLAVLGQRALLPGIGCAQLPCPPATHSLGTTTWQLKAAQRDAFSSPRETLFLWEQEEEALRSGSDCAPKIIQPLLSHC